MGKTMVRIGGDGSVIVKSLNHKSQGLRSKIDQGGNFAINNINQNTVRKSKEK